MTKSDGTRQDRWEWQAVNARSTSLPKPLEPLSGERGQALVELAFVLPLLVLLMIGAIEFGRFCYMAVEVTNAAGSGARYGAQNHVTAYDIEGMKRAALSDGPNVPGLRADDPQPPQRFCSCSNGASSTCLATDCAGARMIMFVQVHTTATVNSMFQYPGIPRSLTLRGQAIMRVAE